MRILSLCLILTVLLAPGWRPAVAVTNVAVNFTAPNDDEFVGPFPSWKSVKDYGARGNGTSDDTLAIQKALDDMRTCRNNGWSTLYFPAGTYLITKTLTTTRQGGNDYQGTMIVGDDPATTILKWGGAAAEMFKWDAWYSTLSRLTFDGSNTATIGLWKTGKFSTACEESDLWFKNVACGIFFDGSANGQAEQLVMRCRFDKCSNGGVVVFGWNTLDVWVWNSLFTDCHDGIRCVTGGFHAYNNVFLRSTEGDMGSGCGGFFSIVGNTSIDSQYFLDGTTGGLNIGGRFTGNVLIKGNKVYDTVAANPIGIASGATFLDNVIASPAGAMSPVITVNGPWFRALNNTFTVPGWAFQPNVNIGAGSQPVVNAFDGDTKTFFYDPYAPNGAQKASWVDFSFCYGYAPAAKRKVVTSYAVTSADSRKLDPQDWTFQASNDFRNWTTLDTQTGQAFTANAQRKVYTTTNTTPFAIYRLSATANTNTNNPIGWKVAEIELLDDTGKNLVPNSGGLANFGRWSAWNWNHHFVLDDTYAGKATILTPTTVTLPPAPTKQNRQIFEVKAGAKADEIQAAIDNAVKAGNRAVVHIPAYSLNNAPAAYNINTTLVVPANADIQLIGDGGKQWGTTLAWAGGKNATGPLLRLDGPTHVIIKNIELKGLGGNNATAVQVTNGDQDKGEVFVQGCTVGGGSNNVPATSCFFVNGIDDTNITAIGSGGYSYSKYGVKSIGGAKLAAGKPANGRIAIISGAAGNSASLTSVVDVQKGGKVAHEGFYIEQSDTPVQQLKLQNTNGQVSFASTRFSINTDDTTPTFLLDNHVGEVTMLDCHHVNLAGPGQWFQLTGDGSKLQAFIAGSFNSQNDLWPDITKAWRDTTAPQADAAFLMSPVGSVYKQTPNAMAGDQYLRDRLAFARSITAVLPQANLPATVTAVRLYGCMITPGKDKDGLEVSGQAAPQQCATPTFTPAAGTYAATQTVTLATTTPNAAIYYTLDGSNPTAQTGTKYTGPVSVDKSLTVKALATAAGMQDSAMATADYVINAPKNVATPTFTPPAGIYNTSPVVTIATTTLGAAIYYTLDGSAPTKASTRYTAPVSIDTSCTLKAVATNDTLPDSAVATGDYQINGGGPGPDVQKTSQPDLAINPTTLDTLKGLNIFNDAIEGTATQPTSRNTPSVYEIVLRNTGNTAEPIKLSGTAGTPDWTVTYFDDIIGGNDITAAITGAGWTSPKLDPQGRILLHVTVTPGTPVAWDTAYPVTLSALSTSDGTKADFVIANTLCANMPLTAVRLAAAPAGAVVVKRPVTLTATPVGGRNVEYCFYVKDATGWQRIQNYSANRVCTWTPTKAGTFALLAWAREVGSKLMWDVNATIWNYQVKPTISAVALSATPAITVQVNSAVLLTATPTGGDAPEYAFYVKSGTGACSVLQPYGAANTCTWIPLTPGTYTVLVWVREKGSTIEYQSNASVVNFQVTP